MNRILGISKLGQEKKDHIFITSSLWLFSISINDEDRLGTTMLLEVPVTLSPIETTDIFKSY